MAAHLDPADRPLSSASDLELVEFTRNGDSAAFGELWVRHSAAGRAVARSHRFDADDLLSESFARIFQAIGAGGGPTAAFRPYLFTTIRNVAIQWGRAKSADPSEDLDLLADPASEEDASLAALDRGLTVQAFRSLPTRWQEALWYSEVEQMSAQEIAPLLGMKANAVSALTYRAREGLRQAWIQAHLARTSDPECAATIEKLGSFTRGMLGTRESRRVRDHLETCSTCPIVAEEARQVGSRLALVLLPLAAGVAGAAGYAAWMQTGGAAGGIVAAAAMHLGGAGSAGAGAGAGGAGAGAHGVAAGVAGSAGAGAGGSAGAGAAASTASATHAVSAVAAPGAAAASGSAASGSAAGGSSAGGAGGGIGGAGIATGAVIGTAVGVLALAAAVVAAVTLGPTIFAPASTSSSQADAPSSDAGPASSDATDDSDSDAPVKDAPVKTDPAKPPAIQPTPPAEQHEDGSAPPRTPPRNAPVVPVLVPDPVPTPDPPAPPITPPVAPPTVPPTSPPPTSPPPTDPPVDPAPSTPTFSSVQNPDKLTFPKFSGNDADPGATIEIIDVGDNVLASATASAAGAWSITDFPTITAGERQVRVRQTVEGEQSAPSAAVALAIESGPAIVSPAAGGTVNGSSYDIVVSGVASNPLKQVQRIVKVNNDPAEVRADEMKLDLPTADPAINQWSGTFGGTSGDHYTLGIRYFDPATGRHGLTTTITYQIAP